MSQCFLIAFLLVCSQGAAYAIFKKQVFNDLRLINHLTFLWLNS